MACLPPWNSEPVLVLGMALKGRLFVLGREEIGVMANCVDVGILDDGDVLSLCIDDVRSVVCQVPSGHTGCELFPC